MALNPRFVGNLRFLAASLAASGQFKEAHEVGRALLRVNPSFSAAKFAAGHAFKDADKRRLFGEHLMLAGCRSNGLRSSLPDAHLLHAPLPLGGEAG